MKLPRNLHGRRLADHFIKNWQYWESQQVGSHIVLRTDVPSGQTLPIPAHKPLKLGTLAAILRMVADHKQVNREELLKDL